MTKPSHLTRKWLLAGTVLTGVLFGVATANAQDAQPAKTEEPAADETTEVVITGSRIKGKEYTSASPVTVITAERSSAAGLISATEILQSSTTAASSGQINNTFTGYIVGGGDGINTISLRGLGAQRSLVLINGRRMPPAGVGGTVGPVDLNTIPSAFVSRYEILKDGASSIYGSDAVAGVVNVITRSNFEGLTLEAQTNRTQDGGGGTANLSAIWGKSFDKGHLALSLEGFKQDALTVGDRDAFLCPQDNYYKADGSRADLIDPTTGNIKCYTHGIEGYVGVYAPFDAFGLSSYWGSRKISPGSTPTEGVPGWAFIPYAERSFNDPKSHDATIISPVKRLSFFMQGEYRPDWLGGGELYSELMFTLRNSEQVAYAQFFPYVHEQSTINPFRTGTVLGTSVLSCGTITSFFGPGRCGQTLAQLGFPGMGANPISLYRQSSEQEVRTLRALGGARGEWNSWAWDVYLSHSVSNGTYSNDAIILDRLNWGTGTNQDTLELMPGNVCGTGAPAGCIPFTELFSKAGLEDGNYSKAVRDWYFTRDNGSTKYTQTILEGSVTGDLFTLPAGPVGSAFGVSFRRDKINDQPGELSLTKNIWGRTTAGVTKGSDTLSEVYAEFEVPLVNNVFLVKDLKLNASGRYSNYDSVGDDTTYKLGLNWALNDVLRLRATHGTSFRAPALYELYLKDQTGFLQQASVDPCINYGRVGEDGGFVRNDRVRANCAAAGLPADFAGGGSSAIVKTGGGLDLKPETSTATTYGIVLTPPETGFRLAVDFWKIEVRDQISSTGAGVVGACYNAVDFATNKFCTLFSRRATDKGIDVIDASYRNIPTETTKGVDIVASYEKDFNFGNLLIDLQATHTEEYLSQLFPGDVVYDYQGIAGQPAWVGNIQTSFKKDDWRVVWTLNYTGDTENLGRFGEEGKTSPTSIIPNAKYRTDVEAFITHDLSVQYRGKDWYVTAAVSNLTDEKPTVLGNGSTITRLGNYPLSSQYFEGYLGRQFYLKLSKSF